MSDLLAADFVRLMKSQIYRGILIFCVECLIFEVVFGYFEGNLDKGYMDSLLNTNFIVFGILLSIFIGLYIGSEYSDGTMRNKLISGNSRTSIYVSNFIVTLIGGTIIQALNFVVLSIMSAAIFGTYAPIAITSETNDFLVANSKMIMKQRILVIAEKQVIGFYIILVYTAIFVLITMLICSRSISVAAVMAAAIVIFAAGMTVSYAVSAYAPEEENELGQIVYANPEGYEFGSVKKKITGTRLTVYLFLDEFLPSSQAQNLTKKSVPKNSAKYLIYDSGIAALATIAGINLFNKKDLK